MHSRTFTGLCDRHVMAALCAVAPGVPWQAAGHRKQGVVTVTGPQPVPDIAGALDALLLQEPRLQPLRDGLTSAEVLLHDADSAVLRVSAAFSTSRRELDAVLAELRTDLVAVHGMAEGEKRREVLERQKATLTTDLERQTAALAKARVEAEAARAQCDTARAQLAAEKQACERDELDAARWRQAYRLYADKQSARAKRKAENIAKRDRAEIAADRAELRAL